ncbi:AI-2E family transporter [Candidatus Saccharibacteria bacterium]|nr:AI-2E family transporter [Candidatus Saccharibacteria bacterium]
MKDTKRHVVVVSPLTFIYLLLTIAFVWVIFQISGIIISLAVAGIFAIALNPIVSSIERRLHIRRGYAVAMVVLSIVAFFLLIIALIIPSTISQAKTLSTNWPTYQQQIKEFSSHQSYTRAAYQESTKWLDHNSEKISSNAATISVGVAGGLFSFLTFFIFLIYMLASGRKFAVILSGMLPKVVWREQFVKLLHDVSNKLGNWLRGQAVLCLIIFVASYIGLLVLGIDYALTLALFAALMEAVPMVGAYLGAIPAVLVAILTGSPFKGLIVAIFFLILQQIEGNIIVPQVMKRAVGVHPMLILLAALIGGTLLGFVGVLIAVPVTAAGSVIIGSLYKYYYDKIEK